MLKIRSFMVIERRLGTDLICLTLDGPSPFPEMEASKPNAYPPGATIECRKGYAMEWLTAMGIPLSIGTFVNG